MQGDGYAMNTQSDPTPATVPTATQAGTIRDRWSWAVPEVWTERMLTALEQGVKGGIWFSLMDKVFAERNLRAASTRVLANRGAAGVDRVTVDDYAERLDENLGRVQEALKNGSYVPQPIRRHWIPKLGSKEMRPLGIPTVRDRVVQTALRNVLEPIFEQGFAEHSYGFRPQRGCKDALRRVNQLLQAGYHHVVDADLKSYFDTIPHDRLMQRIQRKVADGRVLALLKSFLEQGVLDGQEEQTPEDGTPQGAVISPLLANIYLDPLDHLVAEQGFAMVRYADDFVILCRTPEEAERALSVVQQWVADNGLTLHPTKTRIVNVLQEGFDFLGYHFKKTQSGINHWPRKKSLEKLKNTVRAKTHRCNGHSLPCIIADINGVLRGWFGYFQHSLKTTFPTLDGWVRMRLRSILRKRQGRKGRGRGADHQRWPNAYFANLGLYSLTAAHVLACQSSTR